MLLLHLLTLCGLSLLFLRKVVFLLFSSNMINGDDLNFAYPAFIFMKRCLSQGIIPFWNPYIYAGSLFWGDITLSYPTNILFMWTNPAIAIKLQYILFPLLGVVSMFYLARHYKLSIRASYITALTFILWFSLQIQSAYLAIITGTSLTPLVMLGIEKRSKWLWIILGIQVYILGPHFIMLILPLIVWRLWQKRLFLPVFGALCIALPKIISMIYCAPLSTRFNNMSLAFASRGSLNPFLSLWIIAGLFGIIPLTLVFFSRNKYYRWVGIVSLLLAMGRYSPLYYIFRALPFCANLRHPRMFLFPLVFSLAILAGEGFDRIKRFK